MKFFWIVVIDFQTWITFAIASEFILLIPGPTILLVVAYSLSHGKMQLFPWWPEWVWGISPGWSFRSRAWDYCWIRLLNCLLCLNGLEPCTWSTWESSFRGCLLIQRIGVMIHPCPKAPRECCGMHGSPTHSTRKALFFSWPFCPSLSIPNRIFWFRSAFSAPLSGCLQWSMPWGMRGSPVGSVRSFATILSNRVWTV